MKVIKIKKKIPGWDLKPGQIIEIGIVNADHFIRNGFAEELRQKEKTEKNATIKNSIHGGAD